MMSEVVAYLPVSLSASDRHATSHNSSNSTSATPHPPPASTTLINAPSTAHTSNSNSEFYPTGEQEKAPEPEQLEDTHNSATDTQFHDLDVSTTITVGGEPGELGSTTMAERTLVEEEGEGEREMRGTRHSEGGEGSSLTKGAHAHKKSLGSQVSVEHVHDKPTPSWVPLNMTTAGEGIEMQEREKSTVVEEDIVDSKGKLLFPDDDKPPI
ncbi:hypothetical protein M413DRAFT_232476 [Hebeloma cylindrosporum]|uniref:Uncharacterized protein n=1 Tax=Hebeloma cylindrosporum TaxID=76867 RepID=A0A0C3CI94_HEBCY|nr:hypothetical protein M413DRAFT_232476 [Hebeloma cylindrosporum h7]